MANMLEFTGGRLRGSCFIACLFEGELKRSVSVWQAEATQTAHSLQRPPCVCKFVLQTKTRRSFHRKKEYISEVDEPIPLKHRSGSVLLSGGGRALCSEEVTLQRMYEWSMVSSSRNKHPVIDSFSCVRLSRKTKNKKRNHPLVMRTASKHYLLLYIALDIYIQSVEYSPCNQMQRYSWAKETKQFQSLARLHFFLRA